MYCNSYKMTTRVNGHFTVTKLNGPGIFAQGTSSEIHQYHWFQNGASKVTWTNLAIV